MMMPKYLFCCCLFIFFANASQTSEIAYEVAPFVIVYKNGTVERLKGNEVVPPSHDPYTGVQSKDVIISPQTGLSARLYMPNTTKPNSKISLLFFIHGGGFFIETPFSPRYHNFLNTLAAKANVFAVSVSYRRAPEYVLPIAYDDSWDALKWVASHSNGSGKEPWIKDFVDFGHVFLAGDSAGANIAHNMGIRLELEKLNGVHIAGIVLLHPFFWGKHPIGNETTDVGLRAMISKWWFVASPSRNSLDDPLINPLMDPKLQRFGCKRVLVFVAGNDVFRCRGLYYYEALKKSGWNGVVEIMESSGEGHVFFLAIPNSEKAIAVVKRVVSFIHNDKKNEFSEGEFV